MLVDQPRQLKAVHVRHHHVHQDDGDLGAQDVLQGPPARIGLDQVLPQAAEHHLIAEQLARFIIDQENVDFVAHRIGPHA